MKECLVEDYLKRAEAILPSLVRWRRELHQNPELSLKEHDTAAFIEGELRALGVAEVYRIGETGVMAVLKGTPGRTLALRGDIDALPCEEKTELPYKSKRAGIMHACGHDVHATCLLGVARLFQDMKEKHSGTVKLLFQPAEEVGAGAKMMLENGVLDNPAVDAAMMLHCWPGLPAGTLGITRDVTSASSDKVTIEILGKQGHGAHPHLCVDSIFIAGHVITALQGLVSREVPPLESVVLSLCKIEGGSASNIIAGQVRIEGTLRTMNKEMQAFMHQRIREVTEDAARMFRASAHAVIETGTPLLEVDNALTDRLIELAEGIVGQERVHIFKKPSMGSEDFAFISQKIPSVAFRVGTGFANRENPPLHSDLFCVNEQCIPYGVAVLYAFALDFLGIKTQFRE
jgi:amidohydrolase